MQITKEEIDAQIDNLLIEGEKKYGKPYRNDFIVLLGLVKMLNPEQTEQEREIPLTMWNDYYPDPTVPALRMLVFRKHENGFDKVVTKRGGRVLIKEKAYFQWRKEHENI